MKCAGKPSLQPYGSAGIHLYLFLDTLQVKGPYARGTATVLTMRRINENSELTISNFGNR